MYAMVLRYCAIAAAEFDLDFETFLCLAFGRLGFFMLSLVYLGG